MECECLECGGSGENGKKMCGFTKHLQEDTKELDESRLKVKTIGK